MKKVLLEYFRSLAHLVRLLEVGKNLVDKRYEVYLNTPEGTSDYLLKMLVPREIKVIKSKYYKYDEPALKDRFMSTLDAKIQDELKVLDYLKPDIIVSDDNPASRIVSEIKGITHIALINFYFQNNRDWTFRYPSSSIMKNIARLTGNIPDLLFFGYYLEKFVNSWVEQYIYNTKKSKKQFQKFDLWHGRDKTLICDEPSMFPHTDKESIMIGPIYYSGSGQIETFHNYNRKVIYLTIGVSGVQESLVKLSRYLIENGLYVIVSTGYQVRKEDFPKSKYLFVEDWLNSESVLEKADIMIHQGSSLSFYQTIIHQVPSIVIPKHPGHEIIGRYVENSGIGEVIDYFSIREKKFYKILEKILENDSYKLALVKESKKVKLGYGAERAAELISELL
ncbi:MAG: hypothetical protein JW723_12350 [Bacteroidales bacterium]|nr:hypothetical protein [Bacteroidales bacterium]